MSGPTTQFGDSTGRASAPRHGVDPASVFFAIVFLGLAVPALTRTVLRQNENVFLLGARARVDADFLPGDVFLHATAPVRALSEWFAAPWVLWLPLVVATLCLRLVIYAAFAGGLVSVVRQLRLNPWLVAAIVVVMVRFPSFLAGEWMVGGVEAKAMAYPAVLLGLGAALGNRWVWAGLFLGLATSFHLLVGAWSSLAILGALQWRGIGLDRLVKAGVAWLVGASIAIYGVLRVRGADPATEGFPVTELVVYFRNPHHMALGWDLQIWLWALPVVAGVLAMIGVLSSKRSLDSERRLARFALLVIAPFFVGILAARMPGGASFLRLYPFRGEALFLLISALVVAARVCRLLPGSLVRRGSVLAVGVLVVGLAVQVLPNQWSTLDAELGSYERASANAAAWQWVRDNVPQDAVVLCAPDNGEARHRMQRAVVVTFKGLPASGGGIERWYRRLVAMNGGVEPTQRGFEALDEIAASFAERGDYRGLGREFGCAYAVVPRSRTDGLEVLFESGDLAVCLLPE